MPLFYEIEVSFSSVNCFKKIGRQTKRKGLLTFCFLCILNPFFKLHTFSIFTYYPKILFRINCIILLQFILTNIIVNKKRIGYNNPVSQNPNLSCQPYFLSSTSPIMLICSVINRESCAILHNQQTRRYLDE